MDRKKSKSQSPSDQDNVSNEDDSDMNYDFMNTKEWEEADKALDEALDQVWDEMFDKSVNIKTDGIDSEEVAFLQSIDTHFETDEQGRITRLHLYVDNEHLAFSSILKRLKSIIHVKHLELSGEVESLSTLQSDAVQFISQFKNLRYLKLGSFVIPPKMFILEYSNCDFSSLEVLSACEIKNADAFLNDIKRCIKLRELDLSVSDITDEGLSQISAFKHLEKLHLCETSITGQGFVGYDKLTLLKHLYIEDTNINDAGMKYISRISSLRSLHTGCKFLTDQGMAFLVDLYGLNDLGIRGSKISPIGLKILLELRELEDLFLDEIPLNDTAINTICEMKQLKCLYVLGTKISKASLKKIKSSLPNCEITT